MTLMRLRWVLGTGLPGPGGGRQRGRGGGRRRRGGNELGGRGLHPGGVSEEDGGSNGGMNDRGERRSP